jgi:1,4-dihydroxy-2-naphthoate octaprenyltransferase
MTTARAGTRAALGAYARLAKLDVFDYYLAVPVVWALIEPAMRSSGRVLSILLLFLIGMVAVVAAGVALDDVTGFTDGSDAANYRPDTPARRRARKPLLTGELTSADARRFAAAAAATGASCWLAAWLLSPGRPGWALAVAAGCVLISVTYSYGPKISYRGGQEFVLIGFGVGTVTAGYGFATGRIGPAVIVAGLLFGLGPLIFGLYANTNDVVGDAAAGRRTLATVLSSAGHRRVVLAVSAAEPVLLAGAALTRVMPWWLPLLFAPVLVLRARQLVTGLRAGNILEARRLGMLTHRVTAALLVTAGLLTGVPPGLALSTPAPTVVEETTR